MSQNTDALTQRFDDVPRLRAGARHISTDVISADCRTTQDLERSPRIWSPWTSHKLQPASVDIQRSDASLPALQHWAEIREAAQNSYITRVYGAPGCGKTSQIPQIIAESNRDPQWDSQATIWMVTPYVEAAMNAKARLTAATLDVAHSACVSLYRGGGLSEVASGREVVAIHTTRTALLRLEQLLDICQRANLTCG